MSIYDNILIKSMSTETSWNRVGKWYNDLVKSKGHYFHQHIIFPNILRLLSLKPNTSVLDFACGQGVLARNIPNNVYYQGVDAAQSLIDFAKREDKVPNHHYLISDVTRPLPISKTDFDFATIILALQNIEFPKALFENAYKHLKNGGKFLLVINHPYFRIPRQTAWEIDPNSKMQYRRVNRYLSPLKIPINQLPSKGEKSPVTWSFHYPLSLYSQYLFETGFVIEKIEEWVSDKKSVGKAGKMENRARDEFPLFMTILARKDR